MKSVIRCAAFTIALSTPAQPATAHTELNCASEMRPERTGRLELWNTWTFLSTMPQRLSLLQTAGSCKSDVLMTLG